MTETEWLSCTDPCRMLSLGTETPGMIPVNGMLIPASERKLRLLACALCRQVWDFLLDIRSRHAVEVVELYADSASYAEELIFAHHEAIIASDESHGAFEAELAWKCAARIDALVVNSGLPRWFSVSTKLANEQTALIREVFGNPFRPVLMHADQWDALGSQTVLSMASGIYDSRAFDQLPILADAIEDAGCTDESILMHCRNKTACPKREVVKTSSRCPQCDRLGHWRSGVGFEHEKRCPECKISWEPGTDEAIRCRKCGGTGWQDDPGTVHVRGCWALDLLLGK